MNQKKSRKWDSPRGTKERVKEHAEEYARRGVGEADWTHELSTREQPVPEWFGPQEP